MTDSTLSDAMASNYMQADLTLRIWQATKSDRTVADELAASKGADKHALTVTKRLLEGNKELKECVAAYGRVRTWFYSKTLSLGNGIYIVPVTVAMKFLAEFDKLKREADAARDDLLDQYDTAVSNAASRLGSMFDPSNYPSKGEVSSMFNAILDVRPVPATADYDRLAIPGKLASGLKEVYAKRAEAQADSAVKDLQEKLLVELNRVATQLGKVAKGEKTRLYQSLITNMQGLVDLARGLGAIDGGQLSSLADDIERKLLVTKQVGDFKDNAPLARSVSTAAGEIAKQIAQPEVAAWNKTADRLINETLAEIDSDTTATKEVQDNNDGGDNDPEIAPDFDIDSVYY